MCKVNRFAASSVIDGYLFYYEEEESRHIARLTTPDGSCAELEGVTIHLDDALAWANEKAAEYQARKRESGLRMVVPPGTHLTLAQRVTVLEKRMNRMEGEL